MMLQMDQPLSTTFTKLIYSVLTELTPSGKYSTIDSLHGLSKEMEELTADERHRYSQQIKTIKLVIKGFNRSNDKLTNRQITTFSKLLSDISDKIDSPSYKSASNFPNEFRTAYYQSYGTRQIPITKFNQDDIVCEITLNLIVNLSRDVLGSTFNIFVSEYFDMMSCLLDEDPSKYCDIALEIQECLMKYGWDCSGNLIPGGKGFITEPKVKQLVPELELILSKYY